MSIEKYLSLLQYSELYFTRVDRFADEFEGSIPEKEDIQTDIEELLTAFRSLIHLDCWHVNETESVTMWERYAPKGIVIKSDIEHILNALDVEEDHSIHLCEVEYIDFSEEEISLVDQGDDSRSSNLYGPCRYKRDYFTEEREIRLITNVQAAHSRRNELENESFELDEFKQMEEEAIRIDVNLGELIKDVIIHPAADEFTIQAIKSVTERTHELGDRVHSSSIDGIPPFQK